MATTKPDVAAITREMAEALGTEIANVPVPQVVIAPSPIFDEVWNAITNGVFSDNLKKNYLCLRGETDIQFVPR